MTTPSATPSDTPSDAELMRRLGQGQMGALAVLVERYGEQIRATAYRVTGRWDAADDIAQETFLRLHRSAPGYRPTAALSTWLYRIVINLCLDRGRRLARRPELAAKPTFEAADAPLLRSEKLEAVRREVLKLPERQRMVLILHRFEGLDHAAIAEATGWSRSSVESLLVRAYASLRESLKDWVNA